MSSKFKNRLVGTIVIVALVVILLPSLLDGNKKYYQEQFASIPLLPKVDDEVNIDNLLPIENNLPDKPISSHSQNDEDEPLSSLHTQNGAETDNPLQSAEVAPVGQAYVIQLGALRNAARVNELIALLRLSNYRVYTLPEKPIQGEVTRLFVGPYPSKQQSEALVAELKQLTGLEGLVRLYSTARERN